LLELREHGAGVFRLVDREHRRAAPGPADAGAVAVDEAFCAATRPWRTRCITPVGVARGDHVERGRLSPSGWIAPGGEQCEQDESRQECEHSVHERAITSCAHRAVHTTKLFRALWDAGLVMGLTA